MLPPRHDGRREPAAGERGGGGSGGKKRAEAGPEDRSAGCAKTAHMLPVSADEQMHPIKKV